MVISVKSFEIILNESNLIELSNRFLISDLFQRLEIQERKSLFNFEQGLFEQQGFEICVFKRRYRIITFSQRRSQTPLVTMNLLLSRELQRRNLFLHLNKTHSLINIHS